MVTFRKAQKLGDMWRLLLRTYSLTRKDCSKRYTDICSWHCEHRVPKSEIFYIAKEMKNDDSVMVQM